MQKRKTPFGSKSKSHVISPRRHPNAHGFFCIESATMFLPMQEKKGRFAFSYSYLKGFDSSSYEWPQHQNANASLCASRNGFSSLWSKQSKEKKLVNCWCYLFF
ncbi:hypothetical protein CDAR_454171 [Caerostris darwini]|uniref:Ribosomal protein L32 n=1 Tax=Caerostris darwini TaxID=1538125 RepID=A0AAV4V7U6_9ARAC|nr:hypothetical protein CDAR_454171 [Caerostris darwini]